MKKLLSTAGLVVLLVGLGTLAFVALSGGPSTAAQSTTAALGAAPDAPLANKYNVIAMPLAAQQQFADAGQSFNAAGLAALVGPGVQQVLSFNASTGSYLSYIPGLGGNNFNLVVGGVYWLQLDNTAGNIVSFVGDVPAQGSVHFNLVRPASGACKYNDISLPLDKASITNAQQLAAAIGNVEQVLQWNATTQSYSQYIVGLGGTNFTTKIGYPYTVCLQPGGATTWP